MRASELIVALQKLVETEGDLVVTHYSAERHWEPIGHLEVHPAGRPHGQRRNVHDEKVIEIGDDW